MVSIILYIFLPIFIIWLYFKWCYTYFARHNIPFKQPKIPYGSAERFLKLHTSFSEFFVEIYREFKAKGWRYGGVYMITRPYFVPIDPELIRRILHQDFAYFINRGLHTDARDDPLSLNLFTVDGEHWKAQRTKLNIAFTSGRMKMMFERFTECADKMVQVIDEQNRNKPLDIKEITSCFATDVISSCAYGIDANCLKNTSEAEFRHFGRRIFENNTWDAIKLYIQFFVPSKYLKWVHYCNTKKDVENFFINLMGDMVEYREKNNVSRKDFLHLLLLLKNKGRITDDEVVDFTKTTTEEMTISELSAQAYTFFLAGFESASSTTTYTLFELARNPEIQDRLRKEIHDILKKHDNKLTYEAMQEMTYLDRVVCETLRMYPTLGFLLRQCTKNYKIPDSDVVIEKDTMVLIPNLGLHTDPEFYPDPYKFDPERFDDDIKSTKPLSNYMPFGDGPRICIGMRFGLIQTKVGLITILNNYKLTSSDKTILPLRWSRSAFTTTTSNTIYLNLTKIS